MAQHDDTRGLEAEVEQDRASLASKLDELTDRVSIDSIAKQAMGMIRSNAHVVDDAVRANPLALALIGAGVAWLVFGGRDTRKPVPATEVGRWESEGGAARPVGEEAADDPDSEWSRQIDALRQRASASLRTGGDGLRDTAARRAGVLADMTEGMREWFSHGLEDLSDAARERISGLRQQAYAAKLEMQRAAAQGSRKAGRMLDDHPMVAGAVALAMGAALATALPRTRIEDRTFGQESDRLMRAAADALRQERDQLTRVAGDVAAEVKSSVRETAHVVAERTSELATPPGA